MRAEGRQASDASLIIPCVCVRERVFLWLTGTTCFEETIVSLSVGPDRGGLQEVEMDEEIRRGRGKRAGAAAVCCFFFLNTRTKPRTAAPHLSATVAPYGS